MSLPMSRAFFKTLQYSTVHKKRINLYDNLKKAKLGQVNGGVIYIEYTYIATNTNLSSPQIVQ